MRASKRIKALGIGKFSSSFPGGQVRATGPKLFGSAPLLTISVESADREQNDGSSDRFSRIAAATLQNEAVTWIFSWLTTAEQCA